MNKEPFKPKSGYSRQQDAGAHPVLARLPDVADQPQEPEVAVRAAAAGFVDYRFDMPAGEEEAESRPRLRLQPPAYRRSPQREHRTRPYLGASRALPHSNPFAIPSTSIANQLAPVARFLTLFLLFTAIGTFVLSTVRERTSQPKDEPVPSAAAPAGVQQRLEPTSTVDCPMIGTPEAIGPSGASPDGSADDEVSRKLDAKPTDEPGSVDTTADSATNSERPTLAEANGEPLPKVQTTEPEVAAPELGTDTAAARFTGGIQSAENDAVDGPTKPPEVARLPSIFEPPRHAYQ